MPAQIEHNIISQQTIVTTILGRLIQTANRIDINRMSIGKKQKISGKLN